MSYDQFFMLGHCAKLKENVTAHKVSLLLCIQEYCVIRNSMSSTVLSDDFNSTIYLSEKEMRDFMVTLLSLIQSGDIELSELLSTLEKIMNVKMYKLFLSRLEDLCNGSVKCLMDFFHDLPKQLIGQTPTLTAANKASVVGLFIRRMLLAFEKLSFNQLTQLYRSYQHYYKQWKQQQPQQQQQNCLKQDETSLMDLTDTDDVLDSSVHHKHTKPPCNTLETGTHSHRQAEFFIAQQASLLQHNDSAALSPPQLQEKIMDLLKTNPDLAELHYLSYLNNLHVNEYCTAMHSLYHYFDRLSITNNSNAMNSSANKDGNNSNKSTTNNSANKEDEPMKAYRYAILNIAALHFKFGHREESLAALQEAISIAQEYNDNICLQHALGWLHRLGEQNTLNTANLLERAVTKSNELHLPYLTSLGIQAFAKHSATNCVPPSSVFEFLMKSDILNCQHSQLDLMSISYAQKAAMWTMYGYRLMSSMCSQVLLHLNTNECGVYMNGEPDCIALCNLALIHSEEGLYSACTDILQSCRMRYPPQSQYSKPWMLCEQIVIFDRAMHHGKFDVAEQAVLNMASVNSTEAKYRQAILLKELSETTKAVTSLNEIMECQTKMKNDANEDMNPDLFARVTLIYAELYCQTSNFVAAISPLLSCLTYCRRHYFRRLAAMASIYLGYVQFCMNLPQQAVRTIKSQLVKVMTHGTVYDKARVLFLYNKCLVAAARSESQEERRKVLQKSVGSLETVMKLFLKVEDYKRTKDIYYFQARVFHDLGFTAERNKCALQFKQLDQQYPTNSKLNINMF